MQPISTQHELEPLRKAIEDSPEVCLDTEADSLHHYFEKLCLIQFSLPGDLHFLVDPLAGLDLEPLFIALKEKPLVLHGADYDLRMLRTDFKFVPAVIFDTMLAARLAGHAALGLDALVERYEGKHLDHGAQKADWSQRPLSPRLLSYAVEDTRYLPSIAQKLRGELAALGRLEWHRQQCAQLIESAAASRVKDPDEVWRIRGSFHLERSALAILRELWKWRDEEARQWDRPSYMVCNNDKLLELTAWARANPRGNLHHGPVLPKRWPSRRTKALFEALQRAWDLPEAERPSPPPRGKRPPYDPEFASRLARLRAARDGIAKELKLDPFILAPNAMLEAIAGRSLKSPEDFRAIDRWLPWQTELMGAAFLQAIQMPSSS